MRRFLSIALLATLLAGGAVVADKKAEPAVAAEQSFEVVFGQLVFQNAGQRDSARTIIQRYAARQQFDEPQILDVPAGKYGAGPALLVTMRLESRADADEVWADVTRNIVINTLRPVSQLRQSSVVFDAEEGTQTVTEIHKLTIPAEPDDF